MERGIEAGHAGHVGKAPLHVLDRRNRRRLMEGRERISAAYSLQHLGIDDRRAEEVGPAVDDAVTDHVGDHVSQQLLDREIERDRHLFGLVQLDLEAVWRSTGPEERNLQAR